MKKYLWPLLLLTLWFIGNSYNLDDRLHHYVTVRTPSVSNYKLKAQIALPGVGNLSGVVYHPQRKTLFMVINNPETLLECDLKGKEIRRIKLEGFQDTEGITLDQNGDLIVLEERRQCLMRLAMPLEQQTSVNRSDSDVISQFDLYSPDNLEFEGVSYSPYQNSFFIVKEKEPLACFELKLGSGSHISRVFRSWEMSLNSTDFSDIYCRKDGGFLVLSDEDAVLTECDSNGTVVDYLELDKGFHGLNKRIPQAEGVCEDNKGTLYVVSEPNLLYIYEK